MFSQIVRQNVGIDVSAKFFDAVLTQIDAEGNIRNITSGHFDNEHIHFVKLLEMVEKHRDPTIPVRFTLEFTGVYHQQLAEFIHRQGYDVHLVNGLLSKRYRESLESGASGKTDAIDAKALGRLGVERNTRKWTPDSPFFAQLKSLTRERYRLVQDRARLKNRMHALKNSSFLNDKNVNRINQQIDMLKTQIKQIDSETEQLLQSDTKLWNCVQKPLSIKGVGIVTLAIVLAETDGFAKIASAKKLLGFAGYHIKQNSSGTHKGKQKISKRGNKYIRKAMHLPALSLITNTLTYKQKYAEICEKTSVKMKAVVAIQRKLLALIFALWKNQTEFKDQINENFIMT